MDIFKISCEVILHKSLKNVDDQTVEKNCNKKKRG